MDFTSLIGLGAGTLTAIAFVPQVIKTWRSGKARDISLFMSLLFTLGVLLWLVYGVALRAMPIVVANAITLVLSSLLLFMKIRDLLRQRRERLASATRGL